MQDTVRVRVQPDPDHGRAELPPSERPQNRIGGTGQVLHLVFGQIQENLITALPEFGHGPVRIRSLPPSVGISVIHIAYIL